MQFRVAEVRLARRVRLHLFADALELPTPHVFQVLTRRRLRGRLVQIHRDFVALPDFFSHAARHGHAVFQGHAFDRDKRNDIRRAQTRMRARVFREINKLGRLAHAANGGFRHVDRIAHQGDDAAVVVGIHLAVEQIDAIHLHGFDNGVDPRLVSPFREIRYAFYDCWHKE